MIAGLFIYRQKGDGNPLASRVYRAKDVDFADLQAFRLNVIQPPQVHEIRSPISKFGRSTFFHIENEDLAICVVGRQNANVAMIFEFLSRFCKAMDAYFGRFDVEKLKKNCIVVEELLDEVIDNGYPQLTDPNALMNLISKKGAVSDSPGKTASQFIGQVSSRIPGLKHTRNELFVDVNERIDITISKEGEVLSSQVCGRVMVNCKLSGMPECVLGINMQSSGVTTAKNWDCQFHQCVNLSKYQSDSKIMFSPPDGEFQLIHHAVSDVKLPFRLTPSVCEREDRKLEISATLEATFPAGHSAKSVRVVVPMPPRTNAVKLTCEKGRAKYKLEKNAVVWKIERMTGGKKAKIVAEIDAFAVESWNRPPISMNFELPYAPSGLRVRYVTVREPNSQIPSDKLVKWVRYHCTAGECDVRF